MTEPDTDSRYQEALAVFDDAVLDGSRVSRAAADRQVNARRWFASVLFTRICTTGMSLLCLVPRSRFAGKSIEHYDFGAVASLARNIAECYFVFFYLCVDEFSDDEWYSRLNILHLHDCVSRLKMFRDFDPSNPRLPSFEQQAEELRERLKQLPYFMALPEKQRKRFLKGDSALLLNQDQLLERLGVAVGPFRGMYRFISSHVHSFPLAFYLMGERDQGRGVESDWVKQSIADALEFAESPLRRSTYDMLKLFPDIPAKADNSSLQPPPLWRLG